MESSSTVENKSEPRRPRKPKTICLPFEEAEYQRCLDDPTYCRQYIVSAAFLDLTTFSLFFIYLCGLCF